MIYYEDEKLLIRSMKPEDSQIFYNTYLSYDWHPDIKTYETYYKEQEENQRKVFIAEYEGEVCGLCTLVLNPTEGPWVGMGYPEIVDLCVFFHIHNKGIGNKLLDVAEQEAAKLADIVYLAVGVHSGYGAAQRIYVKRGYLPDGSGVWYQGKQNIKEAFLSEVPPFFYPSHTIIVFNASFFVVSLHHSYYFFRKNSSSSLLHLCPSSLRRFT